MNNSYYSGSSYYDEEVSMRSDPPLITGNDAKKDQSQQSISNNKIEAPVLATASATQNVSGVGGFTTEQNAPQLQPPSQQMVEANSNKSFKFEKSVEENMQDTIPGSKRSHASGNAHPSAASQQKNGPMEEQKQPKTRLMSDVAVKNSSTVIDKGDKTGVKSLAIYSGGDKVKETKKAGLKEGDLKSLKVSDILQGNFAPIEIPMIEIPGTRPLVINKAEDLLAEVHAKDEYMMMDEEEEYLMFTAEILDIWTLVQDGPFQTLRWRKKVRNHYREQTLQAERGEDEQKDIFEDTKDQFLEKQKVAVDASIRNSIEATQATEGAIYGEQRIVLEDDKALLGSKGIQVHKEQPLEQEEAKQQEPEVQSQVEQLKEVVAEVKQEEEKLQTAKSPTKPPTAKPPSEKPPSAKPPSEKPLTAKPLSEKPPTAKPPSVKPPYEKPPTAKPPTPKPPSVKAPSSKAVSVKAPSEKPITAKVQSSKPPTAELASKKPPSVKLSSAKPPSAEPASLHQPSAMAHSSIKSSNKAPSAKPQAEERDDARQSAEELFMPPPSALHKSLEMSSEAELSQAVNQRALVTQSHEQIVLVDDLAEPEEERLSLPVWEPFLDQVDDPILVQELIHPRNVQIEMTRPVHESIEQLFVKEVETSWLNEALLLEELKQKIPQPEPLQQIVYVERPQAEQAPPPERSESDKKPKPEKQQPAPKNEVGEAKIKKTEANADDIGGEIGDVVSQRSAVKDEKVEFANQEQAPKTQAEAEQEYDEESYYDEEEEGDAEQKSSEKQSEAEDPIRDSIVVSSQAEEEVHTAIEEAKLPIEVQEEKVPLEKQPSLKKDESIADNLRLSESVDKVEEKRLSVEGPIVGEPIANEEEEEDAVVSQPNLEESAELDKPQSKSSSKGRQIPSVGAAAAVDKLVQEAYGSVRISADQTYVTDDEGQQPKKKVTNNNDSLKEDNNAQSELTLYNPGDISAPEEKLSRQNQSTKTVASKKSKKGKTAVKPKQVSLVSTIKNKKASEEEKEFAKLRETHVQASQAAKASKVNNSSSYVRRMKQPKLIDKQKMMAAQLSKQSAESLPRSSKQINLISSDTLKNQPITSLELIPKPAKKPRPPPVPEHLRASQQSPNPMQQVRESMERISQASKKPRVPKVSELMPDAIQIKPSKMSQEDTKSQESLDANQQKNQEKKFMHSPPPPPRKGKKGANSTEPVLKMPATPSMTNILKAQTANEQQLKTLQKSPTRGSMAKTVRQQKELTPGGVRISSNGRRDQLLQKLIKKKPSKPAIAPNVVENKFGNTKVIKAARHAGKMHMTQQNVRALQHDPDYESDGKSYATLPVQRSLGSPESQPEVRNNQPMMPPLPYNSKQPYEQQMVAQLFTAYRRDRNQLPRQRLFERNPSNVRDRSFNMQTISATDDEFGRSLFEPELISNGGGFKLRQDLPFTTSMKSFKKPGATGKQIDIDISVAASSVQVSEKRGYHGDYLPRDKKQSQTIQPRMHLQPNDSNSNSQQSPFSPTTLSRATGMINQSKTIERGRMQPQSKVSMNKYITQTSNPQDSEPDIQGVDSPSGAIDTSQPMMLNVPSIQNFQTKDNISNNSSFQKLLRVTPSFVNSTSARKKSVEPIGTRNNKAAIYQLLQQNSQSFLQQEKSHIDGFRKAQTIQKKNLDMIISSNSTAQLAPPIQRNTQGNFTQRLQKAAKSVSTTKKVNVTRLLPGQQQTQQLQFSGSNLPQVSPAYYSTYAVLEEYGNSGNMNFNYRTNFKNNDRQKQMMNLTKQNQHMIPYMRQTNQSEHFHSRKASNNTNKHKQNRNGQPKSLSRSNVPQQNASAYPSIQSHQAYDGGTAIPSQIHTFGEPTGIPSLQSGRNKHRIDETKQDAQGDGRSNFLPSFDSRGNVGLIDDGNEFSSQQAKKRNRVAAIRSNLNAARGESIDEIEAGASSSERPSRSRGGGGLPSLPQNHSRMRGTVQTNIARDGNMATLQ